MTQQIPEGYILVPITPTPEMIAAGDEVDDLYLRGTPETWGKVYRAMVSAAQQAEPCEFHDNDRAACEQHSGAAPCEPAPAQDEREFDMQDQLVAISKAVADGDQVRAQHLLKTAIKYIRPAQTEQQPIEIPVGAIENGRAFAERLEMYGFECEGGNILKCSDWQEFRQCFNHLAEWALTLDVNASPIAQTAQRGEQ